MAKNNIKFSAFPVEAVGRWAGSLSIRWRCSNESDFCGTLGCWALNKKFSSGIWLIHNSPEAVPHSQNCIYELYLTFSLVFLTLVWENSIWATLSMKSQLQNMSNCWAIQCLFMCLSAQFCPLLQISAIRSEFPWQAFKLFAWKLTL